MSKYNTLGCCSVTKSCLTLCNPMDCSMPGFLVLCYLPFKLTNSHEFAQTHVHCLGCHPTISSSVTHFSSYPQSFPASESFPMSWLFISGGQSIGASASVLPMDIQGWFPLGLIILITLLTKVRIVKATVFPVLITDVRAGPQKRLSTKELILSNREAGEDSWESPGLKGGQTSQS